MPKTAGYRSRAQAQLFIFSIILVVSIGFPKVYSQNQAAIGLPVITNYPTSEYQGNGQVWSIIQSHDRLMYFGTSTEIIEFDGTNWRAIRIPDNPTGVSIRSLVSDKDNVIFFGGAGTFGYLKPNEHGDREAVSLGYLVKEMGLDFEEIWSAIYDGEFIYFQSREYLFRLEYDLAAEKFEIKAYPAFSSFSQGFLVHGDYIIHDLENGLYKMVNGDLQLISGAEMLAKDRLFTVLPYGDNPQTGKKQFLAGSFYRKIYKFDGDKFVVFDAEVNNYTEANPLYKSLILPNGNILMSLIGMGLAVVDQSGKVLSILSDKSGLQDPSVYSLYMDQDRIVWVGLDNGISKIELNSQVSTFSKTHGITSTVLHVSTIEGQLYITTPIGLYRYDYLTETFVHLPEFGAIQIWQLVVDGKDLLVPGEGFSMIRNGKTLPIDDGIRGSQAFFISKKNPNFLYITKPSGLRIFIKKDNFWHKYGDLTGMPKTIWTLAESADGTIWGGTQSGIAYRIIPKLGPDGLPEIDGFQIKVFGKSEGLSNAPGLVYGINGEVFFSASGQSLRYDPNTELIVPDGRFGEIPANLGLSENFFFHEDSKGEVWIPIGNRLRLVTPGPGNTYQIEENRFNAFPWQSITSIHSEPSGIVWIGSGEGLARFDRSVPPNPTSAFTVMLRGILAGSDTLSHWAQAEEVSPVELPYTNNSLRFQYAAQFYQQEQRTTYQTYLEGFDTEWSAWSRSSYKEYTNLPWGTYTFRVRAKNVFNQLSEEASYTFHILPPWYRTWWAYMIYLLVFGLVATAIGRSQRHRVIKRERQESALREVTLKAEAENERRKNIELISEIGKEITSSLSVENIINTVYQHVNKLMDASVFGIGIFNKSSQTLDFPATKENGKMLPAYRYALDDKNRPATWCFKNKKEILSNDFENDHHQYIEQIPAVVAGDSAQSLVYLPLINKEKMIGVLTAQSFSKNAYSDFHLEILRSIATYAALALDNAEAYRDLKLTQAQLIQSEKMASLGELTAGIAHEIQNPLNFVNNFSELCVELADELKVELTKIDLDPTQMRELESIANDIIQNQQKIHHHGKRADTIVKGMLQHSRSGSGQKELTDINALSDEYLRLSYHGLRAKDKSFKSDFKMDFDPNLPKINVVTQDMGRVLLNLVNNAFYACAEKGRAHKLLNGNHNAYEAFNPLVVVSTRHKGNLVEIRVSDNGSGIPDSVREKIFQPFFTTKPTGQGTGLGLSLSYDIVKAHGGELSVESSEAEGTVFSVELPI